jgi:TRAP-type C4-dicarboxylate transport system permease small subunit
VKHDLEVELSAPAAESLGRDISAHKPDLLVHIQRVVLALSAALITILIFVQVFTRYVMQTSIFGIEDLATFVAVWLYFIGGSLGAWERGHISASLVDFVIKSDRAARWIKAFSAVLTTILSGWMTVWAFQYFMFTLQRGQMSLEINLPMAYVTVAMPIGLALMTFYFLIEALDLIGKARRRPQ